MALLRAVKRYKRKLERKFTKQIKRVQFNIACDKEIILVAKVLAKRLEAPVYVVSEHALQLGLSEIAILAEDPVLKERLCRHLVQDHLLVPVTRPEPETLTKRALRVQNTLEFLRLVETKAGSPEVVREIMKQLLRDNE